MMGNYQVKDPAGSVEVERVMLRGRLLMKWDLLSIFLCWNVTKVPSRFVLLAAYP